MTSELWRLSACEIVAGVKSGAFSASAARTAWLTPADLQQDAFNNAQQPKELLLLPGGHYSVYTDHFDRTSQAAADWFALHLR